jgi:hypothetical protein
MKILHWQIHAYDSEDDKGQLHGVVRIEINRALDEAHAIEQAKKIIQRPFYRLANVWECHTCGGDQDKLKNEMLKFLKKHSHEEESEL